VTGKADAALCEEVRSTQVFQHNAREQCALVWPTTAGDAPISSRQRLSIRSALRLLIFDFCLLNG